MAEIYDKIADLMVDILKWNKNTFPKNTIEQQFLKVEEEYEEMNNNPTTEEWADVYIAATVLCYRFGSGMASVIIGYMNDEIESKPELIEEIQKKLDKNKQRVWIYDEQKKVYHHIDK